MPAIEKNCKMCGAVFIQTDGQSLSCSRECRYRNKIQLHRDRRAALKLLYGPEPKPCIICETVFRPSSDRNICCSRSCYLIRREQVARAKNNKRDRPDVLCVVCGNTYSKLCVHQRACSKSCSYRLKWQQRSERLGRKVRGIVLCTAGCGGNCRMSLDGSPSICVSCRRKVHQVEIKCEVCLKDFTPPKGNYVTCSKECSATHKRTYWRRKNADRRASLRQSKKTSEAQAMAKKQPQKVWPCATCVHGIALPVSETGWMCNANAFACNPAWAKRLYQARA